MKLAFSNPKFLSIFFCCLLYSALGLCYPQSSVNEQKNSSELSSNSSEISQATLEKFENLKSPELERIVGLDGGRLKPFLTFAREQMLFISGQFTRDGLTAPQFLLLSNNNENLRFKKLINIRDPSLRKALGLKQEDRWVSLSELQLSSLARLVQPLLKKGQEGAEFLEPYEKNVIEVYQQAQSVEDLISGQTLAQFFAISYRPLIEKVFNTGTPQSWRELLVQNESFEWSSELKYEKKKVDSEIALIKLRPFLWAGVILFISGLVIVLVKKKWSKYVSQSLNAAALLALCYGFYLRVEVTEFAPVTNMYGTMIWVSLGLGLMSVFINQYSISRVARAALPMVASLLLIFSENSPLILSPNLDPLVAVLRSNFWLTIHVLTIVMSYAVLSAATVMAHILAIKIIRKRAAEFEIDDLHNFMYRLTQCGVLLLSVGIVLGGIWADYSWGRFWGWDPKETWALIADVGFLVVLHARYLKPFHRFYEALGVVFAFLLVIMAWYGVNFILAAGLHSYGFSSGGATAVSLFVAFEVSFVSYCWYNFLKDHTKISNSLKSSQTNGGTNEF